MTVESKLQKSKESMIENFNFRYVMGRRHSQIETKLILALFILLLERN